MPFVPISRHEFDQLLRPVRPAIHRMALHRVGFQAAEDCVQSALLCAWVAISRFDPDTGSAGLATFLRPYVRDACRDYLRRSLRPGEILLPPEEVLRLAELGTPPDLASRAYDALKEVFYDLLARISLTRLQEYSLRLWLDGLTQAQIAAYLYISQGMVSQHIAAGAARLRDAWAWEQGRIEPEVLKFFWECVDDQTKAVYHRPSSVWDRDGNQEERTERATRFMRQDEAERQNGRAA